MDLLASWDEQWLHRLADDQWAQTATMWHKDKQHNGWEHTIIIKTQKRKNVKCEKLPGCYPSVPGLFCGSMFKRMSKSVRTRGLDYVSSLTSAWNAFSEEHSARRKCKCLDHWHLSAGDRAYIGMRHRSSTWSWGQLKKMDHDDLTHCVPCTNPSKHIAIPLPQIASLSVKVQKLGAQTQALAQLHCTAPREPSQLEKTQVPPVHVLHLCLLWCWEFGGKW